MSNTNSWISLRTRYDYANANPLDEIAGLFPRDGRDARVPFTLNRSVLISADNEMADQVHHISGGILGTPRHDIDTNLIHLSANTHKFCERFTYDGFVVCATAKIRKGDWDKHEMARIMHVDSTRGWLEARADGIVFPWVKDLYKEIKTRV